MWWTRIRQSYLQLLTLKIVFCLSSPQSPSVFFGVPQGTILGSILFTFTLCSSSISSQNVVYPIIATEMTDCYNCKIILRLTGLTFETVRPDWPRDVLPISKQPFKATLCSFSTLKWQFSKSFLSSQFDRDHPDFELCVPSPNKSMSGR